MNRQFYDREGQESEYLSEIINSEIFDMAMFQRGRRAQAYRDLEDQINENYEKDQKENKLPDKLDFDSSYKNHYFLMKTFERVCLAKSTNQHVLNYVIYGLTVAPESEWKKVRKELINWIKDNQHEKPIIQKPVVKTVSYPNIRHLKGSWLFYYMQVDGTLYRNFMTFKNPNDKSAEVYYYAYGKPRMIGKATLNNNDHLVIRLDLEYVKDQHVFTFQGIFDHFVFNYGDESIIIGSRSSLFKDKLYSSVAILRQSKNKIYKQKYSNQSKRKPVQIKTANPKDKVENELIKYMSLTTGFKTDHAKDIDIVKEKNDETLIRLGRGNFDNKNLLKGEWVSLSRVVAAPNKIAISYWNISKNELNGALEVIRNSSHNKKYEGELISCKNDRLWFDLSNNLEHKKYIFGDLVGVPNTENLMIILALGTSIYKNKFSKMEEDLCARELIIPISLMPRQYQIKKNRVFKMEYKDFKDKVDLPPEFLSYLSGRISSTLSFPKKGFKSYYERQLDAARYENNYFVFGLDKYSNNGSLFQFTLTIDELGNAILIKGYSDNIKNRFNEPNAMHVYMGQAQLMNRLINIPMEHNIHRNKRKSSHKSFRRQNLLLSLILPEKTNQPHIMVGQLADTDLEGWPDSSSCIIISQKTLPSLSFRPCLDSIPHNSKIYAKLEKEFISNYGKDFLKQFSKELVSLDFFFKETSQAGGLGFHDYFQKNH